MARKVNPVTKLILLYESLNDVERAVAFDFIRAKQVKPRAPKSSAPSAVKRSSRKGVGAVSIPSTESETESAMIAGASGSE